MFIEQCLAVRFARNKRLDTAAETRLESMRRADGGIACLEPEWVLITSTLLPMTCDTSGRFVCSGFEEMAEAENVLLALNGWVTPKGI
jgi:hypothetical protein